MNLTNVLYLAGGALLGAAGSWVALENRMGEKYAEMANANRRAYEKAAGLSMTVNVEAPEAHEEDPEETARLDEIKEAAKAQITAKLEGGLINPYHTTLEFAQEEMSSGPEVFVSISYIDEEDYEDQEDGRLKHQLDVLFDGNEPIFMLEGEIIDDWPDLVGEHIMRDMYQRCPPVPGQSAVLYVRNHRLDADYEVVRSEP